MMVPAIAHEDRWTNAVGESFRRLAWHRFEGARGLVLVVHGHGEHAGRYEHFARHFEGLGAHLWSYDARGHGHSVGVRGDAAGIDQMVDDLEAMIAALLAETGAERLVLFGHSMGGLVVGRYLSDREVHPSVVAAVLSAPLFEIELNLFQRLNQRVGTLIRPLWPRLVISNALDASGISSVPEEVERYQADPLIHDRLSIRLGLDFLETGAKVIANAPRVSIPIFAYHGLDDPCTSVVGTRAFFERVACTEKEMVELPGFRHESHHEAPEAVRALLARVSAWVAPRLEM